MWIIWLLVLHFILWFIFATISRLNWKPHIVDGYCLGHIKFLLKFLIIPFGLPLLYVIAIVWEVISWILDRVMCFLFHVTRKYL